MKNEPITEVGPYFMIFLSVAKTKMREYLCNFKKQKDKLQYYNHCCCCCCIKSEISSIHAFKKAGQIFGCKKRNM